MNKNIKYLLPLTIIVIICITYAVVRVSTNRTYTFDAQRAYDDVRYQVDLGPRIMGSLAHEETAQWIITNLEQAGWQVELQETMINGQSIKNIIAKRGSGKPWVIIGSHYDSRAHADMDPNPNYQTQAVPGANDGASTVAILLELARDIPRDPDKQVWMVFFDNEDNGDTNGAGWSIGSQYFVNQLDEKPDAVVILDMLGDKNLNIYMEKNSNVQITSEIWGVAKELGYNQFIPTYKYALIDDHLPFIQAGIKAVDVIDFDYSYWHTTHDTLDKISPDSLKVVGDTILKWLEQYPK